MFDQQGFFPSYPKIGISYKVKKAQKYPYMDISAHESHSVAPFYVPDSFCFISRGMITTALN